LAEKARGRAGRGAAGGVGKPRRFCRYPEFLAIPAVRQIKAPKTGREREGEGETAAAHTLFGARSTSNSTLLLSFSLHRALFRTGVCAVEGMVVGTAPSVVLHTGRKRTTAQVISSVS